ncbi:MAG: phosphotransferase [Gemmataceae bacterium]
MPLQAILTRYEPAVSGLRWVSVSGGFSGAEVWRGDDANGSPIFALKAWPEEMTASRLGSIHQWMTQAAHLPFVPAVLRTNRGTTVVSHAERNWDLQQWRPGENLANPSTADVVAACVAVAQLHLAWSGQGEGVCPGVLNRLRILADFRTQFGNGIGSPPVSEALLSLLRQAWAVVAASAAWAEQLLRPWRTRLVPLRSCVRDLRNEHVLFSQGAVSGIVDYGAMAVDHPGVDLARFLGDVAAVDETRFTAGVQAYRQVAPLEMADEFVRALLQTGVVCSVIGWLVRLVRPRGPWLANGAIGEERIYKSLAEAGGTGRAIRAEVRIRRFSPPNCYSRRNQRNLRAPRFDS